MEYYSQVRVVNITTNNMGKLNSKFLLPLIITNGFIEINLN